MKNVPKILQGAYKNSWPQNMYDEFDIPTHVGLYLYMFHVFKYSFFDNKKSKTLLFQGTCIDEQTKNTYLKRGTNTAQ